MDDMDMSYLLSHDEVKEIHVIDCDLEAVKEGLKNQRVTDDRIKLYYSEDFTELQNRGFYGEFEKKLKSKPKTRSIIKFIRKHCTQYDTMCLPLEESSYDLVICSGVHSQLLSAGFDILNKFYDENKEDYSEEEFKAVYDELIALRSEVETYFTFDILSKLKKNGLLFIGIDLVELDLRTEYGLNASNKLRELSGLGLREVISYAGMSPLKVSRAHDGFVKLGKEKLVDLIVMTAWFWPFNKHKEYFFTTSIFEKK